VIWLGNLRRNYGPRMGLLPQQVGEMTQGGALSLWTKYYLLQERSDVSTLSYQRPLELGKRMPGRRAITGVCDIRHIAGRRIRDRGRIPSRGWVSGVTTLM
jgi:hypothetical protein